MKTSDKLLTLLLLLITFNCQAQGDEGKLEFGLGISPSISWITSNTKSVVGNGGGVNFGFGAKINYKLSDKYAFGFEVNMQNINSNIRLPDINIQPHNGGIIKSTDLSLNYKLRYLELPVMLKMHTQEKNKLSFYGEFGGVVGFLLNQKANISSTYFTRDNVNTKAPEEGDQFELINPTNSSIKYLYNVNSLRAGLIFGAGVQLHVLSNSRVDIGLRYNLGLSDFLDDDIWKATNSYLALNLGFFF
ncbi:MAG: outer membrane beta-barrel protein [Bacteroidia bacterium]|nr:outer membrane beta-barrel protein [Bacteroidia bacterium]